MRMIDVILIFYYLVAVTIDVTGFNTDGSTGRVARRSYHSAHQIEDSGRRDAVRGVQENGNNRIRALAENIKQNDALANGGQDKISSVSGIYAGDDGYRIHNSGTTVLGGFITSTAKAEAEGKTASASTGWYRKTLPPAAATRAKASRWRAASSLTTTSAPGVSSASFPTTNARRHLPATPSAVPNRRHSPGWWHFANGCKTRQGRAGRHDSAFALPGARLHTG